MTKPNNMKKNRILFLPLIIIALFSLNSCGVDEPLDGLIENTDASTNTTAQTNPTNSTNPAGPTTTTNPSSPNTSGTPGVFKVDFDGKTFVASTVQAIVNDSYISISGLKTSTGELVQITLPAPYNKIGTYTWENVSIGGGTMALAYNPSSSGAASGFVASKKDSSPDFAGYTDTAKIIISKIDVANTKISGTFEFTGVRYKDPMSGSTDIETKKLTNGSFTDIPFTKDAPVTPTNNTFSAKLDGAIFTPTSIEGLIASNFISIVGRRGTVENIGLAFPKTIAPGTYELISFGDNRGQYIKSNDPVTGMFGGDGTATIISHDKVNKKIVGTFSFTGSSLFANEEHKITEGSFTIYYR